MRDSKAAYAVITLENVKDDIIEKAKKVKVCPHCQKEQYDLIFTKPTIFVEKTDVGENRLLPITIRERLVNVTNEDLILLGTILKLQDLNGLFCKFYLFLPLQ